MFVERNDGEGKGLGAWLEAKARQHPNAFTAFLLVMAVGVTAGLLFKTGYTLVLYQGF
jgi:hypothetical protein